MNVILIPFFLAANVIVNDTSDWKFGPEYSYNVSITYNVIEDSFESLRNGSFNSTIKCRPQNSEILVCSLHNVKTISYLTLYDMSILNGQKKVLFAIKFNERGVEDLMIKPSVTKAIKWIIKKIVVNQFNINVTQIRNVGVRPMPDFMKREKTTIGTCVTTHIIKHEELQPNMVQKKDNNFQFEVLPISNVKPNTNLSITKIRKRCTSGDYLDEKLFDMRKFNSIISINDRFKIFTELNGYMKPPMFGGKRPLFKEIIELNLDSIKPAQEELPPSSTRWKIIDLDSLSYIIFSSRFSRFSQICQLSK